MIITFEQHVSEEQARFPGATGEFTWLVSGITLASKMIQAQVRRAALAGILGSLGAINVQGEVQQKLDVYANEALIHCLRYLKRLRSGDLGRRYSSRFVGSMVADFHR